MEIFKNISMVKDRSSLAQLICRSVGFAIYLPQACKQQQAIWVLSLMCAKGTFRKQVSLGVGKRVWWRPCQSPTCCLLFRNLSAQQAARMLGSSG